MVATVTAQAQALAPATTTGNGFSRNATIDTNAEAEERGEHSQRE